MKMAFTTMVFLMTTIHSFAVDTHIKLEIVNKKPTLAWPSELKPEAYAAKLKEIEQQIKDKKLVDVPSPPEIDMVLKLTNVSDKTVSIYMKGDPNTISLALNGPSVLMLVPTKAVTLEFRLPQLTGIEPGKSVEIPLKNLADGFRGNSRHHYFLKPGEYTLKASYQLTDQDGVKTELLKSEAIKLTVEEPK